MCTASLKQTSKVMENNPDVALKPPKFAIANGNFIGALPLHLTVARIGELNLVSPFRKTGSISVVEGGGQKQLRGHCGAHLLDVGVVARYLPLQPHEATLRLYLTGALTQQQKLNAMKPFLVNGNVVRELLQFFREHNRHYDQIELSDDILNSLPVPDEFGNLTPIAAIISNDGPEVTMVCYKICVDTILY